MSKGKVVAGVCIGLVLLSAGQSQKNLNYFSGNNFANGSSAGYQEENNADYQEEDSENCQAENSGNAQVEYEETSQENSGNEQAEYEGTSQEDSENEQAEYEEPSQEENNETSQEEEQQQPEEQQEKESIYDIMSETGFPENRFNTIYQDVSDAVNIVMACGGSGIHKVQFKIEDNEIVAYFSNGEQSGAYSPAEIIDANTLRMYGNGNTIDFVWVKNGGMIELEIKEPTGSVGVDLVDEFAGRTLD